MKIKDLTGLKFNRLTVIKRSTYTMREGHASWECECECGNKTIVTSGNLRSSSTKSCGCIQKKNDYNGLVAANTGLYHLYRAMKNRCYNKKNDAYRYYGGRGITVCDRWEESFADFYEDMGAGYEKGVTSLERKNNDMGYSKVNCKWATRTEQANNTSRNVVLECFGKKQNLKQWADEYGLTWFQLNYRIKSGWSIERALTTPIATKYRRKSNNQEVIA